MNFSIIIPLFNEEKNISELYIEISDTLKNIKSDYEIIFINDSSNDLTLKVINEIKNNNKNIKIINNTKNIGQSLSLVKGINNSSFDTIITLDGDLQNDPKDILKLFAIYERDKEIELVGGIRINRKDTLIKIISSKIANKFRNLILNDGCKDTGCSLKIFNKNTFIKFPPFDGIHRFLPALFRGYQKKTAFVEVNHRKRKYGISNYGTLKRMFKGLRDIIRVKKIIKNYRNKI